MILPALTEATSPFWRPIKYSLFPPLGLATLAGYLDDDEVEIQDEHVETLDLDDSPDLVVIQVYITSAYRAYRLADHYRARGVYVALGGLHVTSLPEEAAPHADTIFIGPGDLSAALGHLGNPRHPEVLATIEDAIRRIQACGKAAGILTGDETLARRYVELGCLFVAVGADQNVLRDGAQALAARIKG